MDGAAVDVGAVRLFPELFGELSVEVAVVGGGLAGATTALLLKRAGLSVALLEPGDLCATADPAGAALTDVCERPWYELVAGVGERRARRMCEARRAAVERAVRLVSEERIECGLELVSGWLFSSSGAGREELERELLAAQRLGVAVRRAEGPAARPVQFPTTGALEVERQARLDPRRYRLGLAEAIPGTSGYVFERSPVLQIHEGRPARLVSPDGAIDASLVLVAGQGPAEWTPVADESGGRSYALGMSRASGLTRGLFWEAERPRHWFRMQAHEGRDLTMVGFEEDAARRGAYDRLPFERLREWTRERFGICSMPWRWTGRAAGAGGSLRVGRSAEGHVWAASGPDLAGATGGTVAAMLLTEVALTGKSAWLEAYQAGTVGAARDDAPEAPLYTPEANARMG